MKFITQCLRDIFYENNEVSLTRVIAAAGYILFASISIYLVIKGQNWNNYETFATFTGGGGAATQVANKFINSRYNTMHNSFDSAPPTTPAPAPKPEKANE